MSGGRVVDGRRELHLEGDDPAVAAFDDEVDFVLAAARPEVSDAGLVGLRAGSDRERDQRFEQGAEEGALPRDGRPRGGELLVGRGRRWPAREQRAKTQGRAFAVRGWNSRLPPRGSSLS